MGDTKERIVAESLRLFSERGYGEVTVAEIAEAVGIKPPSLYKHYGGKREIFEAILERMSSRYRSMVSGLGIDGEDPACDSAVFEDMDGENIARMGMQLFDFFLHDEEMSRFRRMLSIGRYSDPELDQIFRMQYVELPLAYQTRIFESLLRAKGIDGDPYSMALEFYSPMYLFLIACDTDPGMERKASEFIPRHIRSFGRIYLGAEE